MQLYVLQALVAVADTTAKAYKGRGKRNQTTNEATAPAENISVVVSVSPHVDSDAAPDQHSPAAPVYAAAVAGVLIAGATWAVKADVSAPRLASFTMWWLWALASPAIQVVAHLQRLLARPQRHGSRSHVSSNVSYMHTQLMYVERYIFVEARCASG
jgi:hypothetical protein